MRIKENITYYIISASAAAAVGFLLRYLYHLYPNTFISVFASTDNSMFEQMKTLLWPSVVFMAVHESIFREGDFERQSIFLLASLPAVPTVIFILSFLPAIDPVIANILGSTVGITLFFLLCYSSRNRTQPPSVFGRIAAPIMMITIITVFVAFSFNPPKNSFFTESISSELVEFRNIISL